MEECKCGYKFQVFFRNERIKRSRFRCLKCKRTFQRDYDKVVEIDLKSMWEEIIKIKTNS